MEFRYREGERRASSSFLSSSNPQPRLSLDELQRELEEERLKEAIMASRIAQRRLIEEERLHDMRMQRHPTRPPLPPYILEPQPQPLMVLPPHNDWHRDRLDAYLDPVQVDCRSSAPDEVENLVTGGAVRDEGGCSRSNQSGFETKAKIDHKKKKKKMKRAPSAGNRIRKKNSGMWCRICKVSCSGKEAMDSHLSGKKHAHAFALKKKALENREWGRGATGGDRLEIGEEWFH